MEERSALEPSIPEASRQYWWVVLSMALAGAALGIALATFVFNDSKAATSILIEDPSSSQVFNNESGLSPERYLASQVAIIESPDMARAVEGLQPNGDLAVKDIIDSRTIITSPSSDLIVIEFVHADPQAAVDYANSYVQAYEEHRLESTERTFQAAIAGVDSSIDAVDLELAEVDAQLEAISSVAGGDELATELERAIESFLSVPADIDSAEGVAAVLSQLQTLQVIRELDAADPGFGALSESRRNILDRRSQLVIRRDQLSTDAALISTGIVATSEAVEAEPSVGRSRIVLVMGLLGAVFGVILAYGLALRNRRFGHRSEPEAILNVPMLAEIPEFAALSPIPVMDHPSSRHAEAFRFAASAIAARLSHLQTVSGAEPNSLTVTSAFRGEGKTTVALNVALSLATKGKRVLVVDGDFTGQTLTRLVTGVVDDTRGVTDLLEGSAHLADVVIPISLDGGQRVDVLPRGSNEVTPADFFGSPLVASLFKTLKRGYDYVLVDGPALLQVSYASYLASYTDAVVTVIPHNCLVSSQQEVSKRLSVVGADLVGYVYNRASKRADSRGRRSGSSQVRKQRAASGAGRSA